MTLPGPELPLGAVAPLDSPPSDDELPDEPPPDEPVPPDVLLCVPVSRTRSAGPTRRWWSPTMRRPAARVR